MTPIQHDGSELVKKHDLLGVKRAISERKLQANRANAKRSTGPRTEAGKAAARRNALKHGILSRSVDPPNASAACHLRMPKSNGSLVSEALGTSPGLQEIDRIWSKLARIVVFERECAQRPDGLERNERLICRYERMLTRQLHDRIREWTGLIGRTEKAFKRSL